MRRRFKIPVQATDDEGGIHISGDDLFFRDLPGSFARKARLSEQQDMNDRRAAFGLRSNYDPIADHRSSRRNSAV